MLTQLDPKNYGIIRDLFPKDYPNLAFIYAAIENKIKGEIWVDDVKNPQSALVICSFYIFLSGKISKPVFDDCYQIVTDRIKLLAKMSANVRSYLSLVCPQNMLEAPVDFEKLGFTLLPRVEYGYEKNAQPEYKNESQYDVKPIDMNNISNCMWHGFILDICSDNDFSHHLGFMLWDNESQCVVSEAYGIVGGDIMEIASVTNPKYLKQGLSTNVCTRLISEAAKKGLHPIWSCAKDNIPSNKTAQALGMEVKQEYSFHNIGMK